MAKPAEVQPKAAVQPPAPKVNVNRTVPAVTPPSATPAFSATPTAAEFLQARIFVEPFVPVGGEPSETENAALAAAVMQYVRGKDPEDLTAFGVFLNDHPESAWRASLVTNLGAHYKATGYYTKATETLTEGWQLAKDQPGRAAAATAERALSELLDLHMQFGRVEPLETLMAESEGRDLHGGVNERITQARAAIYILREAHHEAIASAAVAVDQLQGYGKRSHRQHAEVAKHHASHEGASLADVGDLAQRAGTNLRLARRADGDFVPGSIVHLKSGHFSALVRQEGDRFLLADPMLNPGGEVWLSRAALLDESSGYALLPAASTAQGWGTAARQAVGHIRGKCVAAGPNAGATGPDNHRPNPCCTTGTCDPMAVYSFHSLLVSLSITDTPVRYSPPRGPWIGFQMTYNQREAFQPTTFTYSNLGPRWNHDWLSYIEDTPSNPLASAKVFMRGGGSEVVTGFAGDRYLPATGTRAVLVRTSTTPIRYERHLPDGSIQVFAQSDTGVSPRRVFMTQWKDTTGNTAQLTYDAQFRIVSVTDAIGHVTSLSYGLSLDPLKITKVTDPFGRAAAFEYNAAGALVKITDVIGITSEFAYGGGDFIRSLTTPYGTTTFAHGLVGAGYYPMVWLEATDPLGGKERLERVYLEAPGIPATEPANLVPQGFTGNAGLNGRNSFYWDKRAMALHPGDYTKARITRWLWDFNANMVFGDYPHSTKNALENRVWYGQMGERYADGVGPDGRPAKIGRVLDDGTSQIHRYEYNSKGLKNRVTDPVGRETIYTFAANEIDLLNVKQRNGGNYDLLWSATYNTEHQPLTTTDASGQAWAHTYNAQGQVLTMTTPVRPGITENRTTTYTYDTNGYLESSAGPASGATTSFTYDGYGRVRTVTDPDSYVLTYDYDALDRQSRLTYPDGSYEQTAYNRLDAEQQRDRLGRWTHTFYDALRRPVAVRDSLGQTATLQWCNCGSLEKAIDPNGNATSWERDVQGRVTRTIRPDGTDATLTYENATSRPQQFRDPKQQLVTIQHFADNNWKQVTFSNTTQPTPTVSFTYDPVYNRLATMTDGTGTTVYGFNPVAVPPSLGAARLASVDGPLANDVITYTYDELGRLVGRGINAVSLSQGYDALGRMTGETNALGAFTYGYEGVTDRLASLAYPNGQTTTLSYFGNTQDHRLQDLHNKLSGGATLSRFQYSYAADGAITSWTQQTDSNPAKVYDLGHDAVNQLTAAALRTTDPTPVVLKRYNYSYDKTVNRTGEQIDNSSTSASINTLNAITALQPGGALRFAGTLNEAAAVTVQGTPAPVTASNQFSGSASVSAGTSTVAVVATDPSGNTRTNTYQVTQAGSTKTLTYDANGSLISDGTRTFEWDGANRLTAVNQGTHRSEFTYDGWSHRVRIVEKDNSAVTSDRRFLWCGTSICEERDAAGGNVTRRLFGQGMQEGGSAFFYARDHLESIRELTDAAGAIRARYDYDPYGRTTKVSGDKDSVFTFTGFFAHDPSGLALASLRAYDPSFGRWISQDPIGLRGGMNAYSYVNGMPVEVRDPLGLFDAGVAAGSIAAAEATIIAAGGIGSVSAAGAAVGGAVVGAAVVGWVIGTWIDQTFIAPPTDPQGGAGSDTGTGSGTGTGTGTQPQPPPNPQPPTPPVTPFPRDEPYCPTGPKQGWTCEASGQVVRANEGQYYVWAWGYGTTQALAALAAKDNCQKLSPLGMNVRHIKVKRCWRG